ncbi:MAG: YihA family ribosome biogenesis GTP-binding protein [Clostridiaceae bacterium]|nr:YihA family ribosome biogenesis GTP-binding protein [Clostridiaceae bacterium]
MIIKKAEFIQTAVGPSQYPESSLPEFALAGRSNVGKSSFINALTNRKNLARTGSTPGKTRVINFYNVNDELMLVDLPGYGYAKVSKQEQQKWGKLVETYLNTRTLIKGIVLLVDIRHKPTRDDIMMANYIRHTQKDMIVIATKADKISRANFMKHTAVIRKSLGLNTEEIVIPFSAEKRFGIEEAWAKIESIKNRE